MSQDAREPVTDPAELARAALAWLLYGCGDLIWRVFDRWLRFGMSGPVYRTYSALMRWSEAVQGGGPGPWSEVDYRGADGHD